MAGFDSIIFDLDGTLWDSSAVCARAWNRAIQAARHGSPEITPADVAGCMGLTAEEIRARVFGELPRLEGQNLLAACLQQEILLLRETGGGTVYPGVPEGLGALARKYSLYLVSNCDEPYLEMFLATSGLGKCFSDSECHGGTGLRKGENILRIMQRNRIRSAIYVGDTAGDQTAADFAGIPFVFMKYGFGTSTHPAVSFDTFPSLVLWALERSARKHEAARELY